MVGEGQPDGESEFDAITGATFTTNFVKDLLNDAVAQVRQLMN